MADLGRRGFLGGAGLLAGVLASCRPKPDPYAPRKPPVPVAKGLRPGTENRVRTTCGMCQAGCGLVVRVVEGRAVKVSGDPDGPVNRGGVCARGLAAPEMLYHPDRILGPMRRVGARGEGHWQAVSWDEAIALLAAELGRLRQARAPWGLTVVDGERTGSTHALWARFLEAFGSPNHIGHGATSWGAWARVVSAVSGSRALPGYDFERARTVLLVGTGALESSPESMHLARAIASGARPRVLCLAPRLPHGEGLVDRWLPVLPGREATVLLGIAGVLLGEQLGDESALAGLLGEAQDHEPRGLPAWRTRLLADFAPEKVEASTGLPARRLVDLARGLVADRPSVVVPDGNGVAHPTAVAALVVNALLGACDGPGGLLLGAERELFSLGRLALDDIGELGTRASRVDAREGQPCDYDTSRLLDVPGRILAGKPYPTKALLFHYANPLFTKVDGNAWLRALGKVPFVASFSPLHDESVRWADLVLPDLTFLERYDIVQPERGSRALGLRQPVVEPVTSGMQTADVILRLARALGEPTKSALPWPDVQSMCKAGLAGTDADPEEVLSSLEDKGVWVETVGKRPSLGGRLDIPKHGPVAEVGDATRFPFVLVPFRGPGYAEGGTRHLPWLAELPMAAGDPWQPYVEMESGDAQRLGVVDGERVMVTSPVAELALRVQVRTGLVPGTLGLPLGSAVASDASDDGHRSVVSLLSPRADEDTGQWCASSTRARVRKV
jgi:anaerobic selenocysteine-containing dehydrogenase